MAAAMVESRGLVVLAILVVFGGALAQECSTPIPSEAELHCGETPSDPTLTIHPGQDFERLISTAPERSRILMNAGRYFVSQNRKINEPLRIPNGTTIWGEMRGSRRLTVWDGSRNHITAIYALHPWDRHVRIYGIKFENFFLPQFDEKTNWTANAVLDLSTQFWQEEFNATNDPVFGYVAPAAPNYGAIASLTSLL